MSKKIQKELKAVLTEVGKKHQHTYCTLCGKQISEDSINIKYCSAKCNLLSDILFHSYFLTNEQILDHLIIDHGYSFEFIKKVVNQELDTV